MVIDLEVTTGTWEQKVHVIDLSRLVQTRRLRHYRYYLELI